jgi:hypothetical protein
MILRGTRRLLFIFSALTLLAFVVLFIFSGSTDRYFAWKIAPPVTAAFAGAAYAAGCLLVLLGLRAQRWSDLRIPYLTIVIFTVVTLASTLLHLGRFHFGSPVVSAQIAAWLWLAVYIVVPVLMIIMLVRQERDRAQGAELSDVEPVPLPRGLGIALAIQGAVIVALGALLFILPALEAVLWPWRLTPLTARSVAAWLVAFGFVALFGVRRNDLNELKISAWAYGLLAVLELTVVARFFSSLRWQSPATWLYMLMLISILVTAVVGLLASRSHSAAGGAGRPSGPKATSDGGGPWPSARPDQYPQADVPQSSSN